jgi:hypothetical protein
MRFVVARQIAAGVRQKAAPPGRSTAAWHVQPARTPKMCPQPSKIARIVKLFDVVDAQMARPLAQSDHFTAATA